MTLWKKLLAPPAGGGGGLTSLTFVDSANSIVPNITIPAGAQAGDLAVLFEIATTTGSPTPAPPTDWTNVKNGGPTSNGYFQISYKILVGGDPGATITGIDGNAEDKAMLVFRPNGPISVVTLSTWTSEINAGDPSSQAINASGQPTPLVVLGMAGINNGTAAFSTASPAFDATVLISQSDLIVGYKIYNSSPADHTIDMDDLGVVNILAGGYIAVS